MSENLPALIDEAKRAIEGVGTFDDVKAVRDKAETLRAHYGRVRKGIEAQNQCAIIKLRCERRMGEELSKVGLRRGRPTKNGDTMSPNILLRDLGVSRKESERWQLLASLGPTDFEAHLETILEAGAEITTAGALKFAKALRDAELAKQVRRDAPPAGNLAELAASGALYGAIYADPPWRFDTYSERGLGRSADLHYPTMTVEEICALGPQVSAIAKPDSVLFLWAYDPLLHRAFEVIEAWGFTYKTVAFTWFKTQGEGFKMGKGYWTREGSEQCLLATRGNPKRLNADVAQSVSAPWTGRHSKKPEGVAKRIERLVPGAYVELFARRPRKDWTVWGNEAGT